MKKKIILVILLLLLCSMSVTTFVACEDDNDEPIQVLFELINPTTGEVVKDGDTIDLPTEKTYIEVRVKVKETGEYLIDSDIPENTVKGSYQAVFILIDSSSKVSFSSTTVSPVGYWPTLEQINEAPWWYDTYEVKISFDCKPISIVNPKFKRKYFAYSSGIRININK